MQLFGLLNSRKESDEVATLVKPFPSEGINLFFVPRKHRNDELPATMPKQQTPKSRPKTSSSTTSEHVATQSKQKTDNSASTAQKAHDLDPTYPATSNVMPAGTNVLQASALRLDAQVSIPIIGLENGSKSAAEKRSCPDSEKLDTINSNCQATAGQILTLEDAQWKELPPPKHVSPCFRSQHSVCVHNPNSSIAQLERSRLRALSELPTRHCIDIPSRPLLRRRFSFDMVELSKFALCSVCNKRFFSVPSSNYKW